MSEAEGNADDVREFLGERASPDPSFARLRAEAEGR